MGSRKPSAEHQALIDEAAGLGIVVKGKTDAALKKAIAQAKGGSAPAAAPVLGGKAPAKNATEVRVIGPGLGEEGRVYSEETHGDNFRELADEFAAKVEGRKVVAA